MENLNFILPNHLELIKLETKAKTIGSKIKNNDLYGIWKFKSVWSKGKEEENKLSSLLLRLLSASLELRVNSQTNSNMPIGISNSIKFHNFSLEFRGVGEIKGNQPLLPFTFEKIFIKWGAEILWESNLAQPPEKERPFFALIHMNESKNCLSARGRGGGIAIWLKT